MPSVAVIILNWNSIDDTLACLASLKQQSYTDFTTVIVDNGSTDESAATLKNLSKTSDYTLLLNETNLGFSGGENTGIRWAIKNSMDYVALINPDAIVERNWLKNLLSGVGSSDKTGIVTSLLLHEDGKSIDSTGDFYSVWGIPSPRLRNKAASNAPVSGFVFAGSGGASLYSTTMLQEIGLFDEDFFAYYEDVDISFRAQLAGYRVYYEKSAVAFHKRGVSSSKINGFTTTQAFKNLPLLFWKNVPFGLLVPVGMRFFTLYILMYFNAIRRGEGTFASKGVLRSIVLFWTSSVWKRFSIQRKKVVSTSYIRSIMSSELPPDSSLRRILYIFRKRT